MIANLEIPSDDVSHPTYVVLTTFTRIYEKYVHAPNDSIIRARMGNELHEAMLAHVYDRVILNYRLSMDEKLTAPNPGIVPLIMTWTVHNSPYTFRMSTLSGMAVFSRDQMPPVPHMRDTITFDPPLSKHFGEDDEIANMIDKD